MRSACASSRCRRSFRASPISRRCSPRRGSRRRPASGPCCSWTRSIASTASQQDGFLPYVEDGTVTLVGATTENPSFELNAALLSRCQVLILHRLDQRGAVQAARPRRGTGRTAAAADRRSARRAGRQRRRRRPLPAQPGRDLVRRRAGGAARSGRPRRASCSAGSRSTTRTARAITTSSPRCISRSAAPTRRRRSIIWRGCWSPARSRCSCCAG